MATRKKSDLTRNHILEIGRELVLRKGFGGVGLKELLEQSAVPKGSFYYYFASKEAFGCALLKEYCADYAQRLDTLFGWKGNGRQRLMHYWNAWLADGNAGSLADRCLVVKLAAEISDLSESMRVILLGGVDDLLRRIATTLMEGRDDGSISPSCVPEKMARSLYSLWLGAAILAKLGKDKTPLDQAMFATEQALSAPGSL
ncbi:TetR/AcrR family transcriptional regulator [Rhizobium lusitanum]|uniref:TetR/AcrR family transcriptional repressor of nem operon n=1 Tax=Rhizobium lusitanum TaxID=293958 RepID=A0A7X0MDV6_9HYPH|nr:TetR/AcrR family transcriptional regulator [Rhizobium lusitanum]MBB6487282.1 TetR/AcrR family transcriptional repressor of nem operon [Rhizobium lusitanum]